MVVSRLGVQPTRAKVEAVGKLVGANSVEEDRLRPRTESNLRMFQRGYRLLVAPSPDLLRDNRFESKMARRLPVPWSAEQDNSLKAQIEFSHRHRFWRCPTERPRFSCAQTPASWALELHSRRTPGEKNALSGMRATTGQMRMPSGPRRSER